MKATGPTTPRTQRPGRYYHTWLQGLAILRVFRSPLLAESLLFSSPAGTKIFQFPAFPPSRPIYSPAGDTSITTVPAWPCSDILGSKPGRRIPLKAYRRLPRPSSAPGAKTSTVCSYKLDTACTTCKLLQNEPRLRKGRALCRRCSRPLCSSQDTDGTKCREPPSGGSKTL